VNSPPIYTQMQNDLMNGTFVDIMFVNLQMSGQSILIRQQLCTCPSTVLFLPNSLNHIVNIPPTQLYGTPLHSANEPDCLTAP
jgi:hypothetical protein